ncbi:MAG: phosphopentomutase [Actinobacteria bacterium]|nr:phosphopentomutase [Actinomycetota bacterium]MBS3974229.1 phosphopentomutase [Actinomycetota bacterium]
MRGYSGGRAILLVLDGVGAGALPDAAEYGDSGSNTLANVANAVGGLDTPNLQKMGLGNILSIPGVPPTAEPIASWGRNREASAGKDTTTGHWEMMGLVIPRPFPTYPQGFPADVLEAFTRYTGLGWLGNYPASGTEIIQELGEEHEKTGFPIVYTSADSVFQIAAHEQVIDISRLYDVCSIAREKVCVGEHAVGRVIARPFIGPDSDGRYVRTHRRRDFAIPPFERTVLDTLAENGVVTYGIGKIGEIFAWQGVCESPHTTDNMDGFSRLVDRVASDDSGFVFANLVDFDMIWGHRNDAEGFARGLHDVDARMPELLDAMNMGDLLIITADHGCDPTTPSTDHSREHTPLIGYIKGLDRGVSLGVRSTFADIGATILDFYGIAEKRTWGASFLSEMRSA